MIKALLASGILFAPLMAAQAGVTESVDPIAFSTMSHGNYALAEARLAKRVAKGSEEPGVLLNLAHVYAQDGRGANAAAMYRQVLATPNVEMEMSDGSPAWSHDLAQRGLSRVTSFASR